MSRRRGASSRRQQRRLWQQRLRYLRAAAVAGLVAAVAGAAVFAARELLAPGHFPVRHIRLSGVDDAERAAELKPLLSRYWGHNLLSADIAALRAELLDNPWLRQAAVYRVWPDGLHVDARLRQAFGRWGEAELIDVRGERFRPERLPEGQRLPRLYGPNGQEKIVLNSYRRAAAVVAGLGLRIAELRQDRRLAWQLRFDNGIRVVFSKDDLGNGLLLRQLRRFAGVYRRVLEHQATRIETVDMRHPGGFAVRWHEAA